MILGHRNRIRRTTGNAELFEMDVAEARGPSFIAPTAVEIQHRAYGIYLNLNGASGNAVADWLQAECELHTGKALSALPLNRRSCAEPYSVERSRTRVRSES